MQKSAATQNCATRLKIDLNLALSIREGARKTHSRAARALFLVSIWSWRDRIALRGRAHLSLCLLCLLFLQNLLACVTALKRAKCTHTLRCGTGTKGHKMWH